MSSNSGIGEGSIVPERARTATTQCCQARLRLGTPLHDLRELTLQPFQLSKAISIHPSIGNMAALEATQRLEIAFLPGVVDAQHHFLAIAGILRIKREIRMPDFGELAVGGAEFVVFSCW